MNSVWWKLITNPKEKKHKPKLKINKHYKGFYVYLEIDLTPFFISHQSSQPPPSPSTTTNLHMFVVVDVINAYTSVKYKHQFTDKHSAQNSLMSHTHQIKKYVFSLYDLIYLNNITKHKKNIYIYK